MIVQNQDHLHLQSPPDCLIQLISGHDQAKNDREMKDNNHPLLAVPKYFGLISQEKNLILVAVRFCLLELPQEFFLLGY